MRLTLTRKGDSAVRTMLQVGRHDGLARAAARRIAAEMAIPYGELTDILAELVDKGLLDAKAGSANGYALARPAGEITLLDIVEVAEGPVLFDRCVLQDGPCEWEETCPVHDTWSRAQSELIRELSSVTLAVLVEIDADIEAGTHRPERFPHAEPTERHGKRG
jgi:Rrf2 family iron-sulfur cluster assembly transcriptional regulator